MIMDDGTCTNCHGHTVASPSVFSEAFLVFGEGELREAELRLLLLDLTASKVVVLQRSVG